MNLVDSCGWVEYFIDGPLSDRYAQFLKKPKMLVTPPVVQYALPMADAIVYTTALEHNAAVITGDIHFRNLPKVTFIE